MDRVIIGILLSIDLVFYGWAWVKDYLRYQILFGLIAFILLLLLK